MRSFANIHAGETCTIIGNGPSLKSVPAAFLHKYPSFGTNRIYLLDNFTPNFYVSVNPLVIEQCKDEINELHCIKFITSTMAHLIYGSYPIISNGIPRFCYEPYNEIYEGFTVTFAAMQLAYYMGFDTVLLVGVDHRFKFDGAPNMKQYLEKDDKNHFSPDYFKDKFWHTPDLERSNEAYKMANEAFLADDRMIINLTPNSGTSVFNTQELRSWL